MTIELWRSGAEEEHARSGTAAGAADRISWNTRADIWRTTTKDMGHAEALISVGCAHSLRAATSKNETGKEVMQSNKKKPCK